MPVAASALIVVACGAGTPAPLTPDQVPAAFVALTGKPDRTVHMEWSGSTSLGGGAGQAFDASFDLAGQNYAGSVTTPGELRQARRGYDHRDRPRQRPRL